MLIPNVMPMRTDTEMIVEKIVEKEVVVEKVVYEEKIVEKIG